MKLQSASEILNEIAYCFRGTKVAILETSKLNTSTIYVLNGKYFRLNLSVDEKQIFIHFKQEYNLLVACFKNVWNCV